MKYGRLLVLAAAAAPLLAPAPAARAQSTGAQAEALFRQGKELMASGKTAEACAAFDASQKLEPATSTVLNQAACREKNEQYATAWGLFLDVERQTRSSTDTANQQFHATAVRKAAALEPRLSTLTITVPPDSRIRGLQITRAGDVVDPAAWNKALPIDGGSYRISATAPGNAEWSSTITVGNERDARTIEIPKLKAAQLEPPHVAAAPVAPTAPASSGPAEPVDHPRSKVLPLALGGAAIALAGGAIGFELWAESTYDKSKAATDNNQRTSLWHSANTRRYVAEGLGVAAIASAGVAVWFYLRPPGGETATATARASRVQLAPVVGSDGAGLLMIGRY